VFWVTSVLFDLRNTLPKYCPFLLGHPVYIFKRKYIHYRWPLEPEFAGSNPAEAVGFFGHPKNSQYAFLRRGSKIICPMSQLCGM
jgi:hypothetical protein